MITGSFYYPNEYIYGYKEEAGKKIYFVCEHCGSRYLLPEPKGQSLIRLVCSGCGGRLKEEIK